MRPPKPASVLIIGSGPIIIGQAAEFDYAGTQACKAMREEGIRSILVNSNPATIMTDEEVADVTYIEPLTVEVLERIIARERPDALLPTLGGQTGLNLAVELHEAGILGKYNVRLLGSSIRTIKLAEDRELFRQLLTDIGEPTPVSVIVESWEAAQAALDIVGLPAVVRPAYTLGGTGGGIAHSLEEYERIMKNGLDASPISQVLVEQSLLGWKELEYEVMRDGNDTCITICNMENLDPMGVHTGDSIVVAPSQTLSDREYHMLRNSALKIIRALGIEGGCNVQFALAPRPDVVGWAESDTADCLPYHVIEVNPRVSRSSALASKATGYPIARVAAKIAVGKRLHEVENAVTRRTTAAFEPALDYVVVKIPRWPFDKFAGGDRTLGTQMKATGEVMAIDRTFEGALQKAIRSLEFGSRTILWERSDWPAVPPLDATDERIWAVLASIRRHVPLEEISGRSGIDPWFVERLARIVEMERTLLAQDLTPLLLREAKRLGFADRDIATLADRLPDQVRALREEWDIRPVYKMVDTCAAEFDAVTPYFYSTYEDENEAPPTSRESVLVLGSGPIRIGQGIEFDYCSVRAARALQHAGIESIMANSNPETVSTDFDTSDRLYFEPLDEESVRDLLENEAGDSGEAPRTIVQFGGQTAINMAKPLNNAALPIAGSSADSIDLAEDRGRFGQILAELDIPQPPGAAVHTLEEALSTADAIGYPVLVRPSYVLGGRAMEVVQDANELVRFFGAALAENTGAVLIDKYLVGPEVEVDAICDGVTVLIPGIMEHIERAGVHSGDSMAVYPPQRLTPEQRDAIVDYTTRMALALQVRGLMNVQFVIAPAAAPNGPGVFVIEVNPRSSRTVPFLSKVTGVPMVDLAVNIMLGRSLLEQGYSAGLWPERNLVAVKAPVFSMSKLVDVDTFLGPEMKSTGEVMGVDYTFGAAVRKALIASGLHVTAGTPFLLSLSNQSKAEAVAMIRDLHEAGCRLYATEGTAALIEGLGIPVEMVTKRLNEGHPNVVDVIRAGTVKAVINTVEGGRAAVQRDGFHIRRNATEMRIPCFTSIDTARAAIQALAHPDAYEVRPLLEYRDGVRP
ncbi:MAG: carbamoyl-phosphate synthase large subunit [Chloroflexi bacterium]|nr:carbamoyl-phosphate synthase large subunit [Chloroflexota bacterium]MQC25656.1 carbamoyl-phosphate synthase large subunit [Chloroflexota bacterium]MQC48489.1 carbamoyl-phosphate synthase large subunit [Chloroflexota bacterium]